MEGWLSDWNIRHSWRWPAVWAASPSVRLLLIEKRLYRGLRLPEGHAPGLAKELGWGSGESSA